MGFAASHRDPALGDVLKAAAGLGGLTLCLTLVFRGMRAVMDVGGSCADGGPYVSAQSCPDGAVPAVVLGIFGLFLTGGVAMVYGARLGGIWGAAPLLGWTGLFGSLGWNFLDYGLFNPRPGFGVEWGWIVCGVIFELMAFGPLLFAIPGLRVARGGGAGTSAMIRPLPMRDPVGGTVPRVLVSPTADAGPAMRPATEAERLALRDVATVMDAVLTGSVATGGPGAGDGVTADAGGGTRGATAGAAAPGDDFPEGTQALLDRLERLGDMRDRGVLTIEEFETAKASIVAELERRS